MIINADCIAGMGTLDDSTVQTCITSPPYYGLRDYGVDGQIGLEETPDAFIQNLVDVFREVRRVLRGDGTLWLNLGDSYVSVGTGKQGGGEMKTRRTAQVRDNKAVHNAILRPPSVGGIPSKNLLGIPWRVALAIQADGWYLRQDIIWSKPNPMPESVKDRCTKSHEYLFLLSKSSRYYYDAEAIKEPDAGADHPRKTLSGQASLEPSLGIRSSHSGIRKAEGRNGEGRNKRSVWTVPTVPFPGAHFATFPPELIRPCVIAGSPVGGVVLDPFAGSGTTGMVALQERREFIGVELSPEYAEMAKVRIREYIHPDSSEYEPYVEDDKQGVLF